MAELHEAVKDMLKKGRTEKHIIRGLEKLGYTAEAIQEALSEAKRIVDDKKPQSLLEMGKFFERREEKYELKKEEIPMQDAEHPFTDKDKSSSAWVIPAIGIILLVLVAVTLFAIIGEKTNIKDNVGSTIKSIFTQEEGEFKKYCLENLEGYNDKDTKTLCSNLDKAAKPINLKYTDMSEACRRIEYDQLLVQSCILELTRTVDKFNQANP